MLTNNFYTLLKLLSVYGSSSNYLGSMPIKLKNIGGALVSPYTCTYSSGNNNSSNMLRSDIFRVLAFPIGGLLFGTSTGSSGYSTFVVLGSGVGAASTADYCLQKRITSGLNSTISTSFGKDSAGNFYAEATIGLTATESVTSSLVIGEVGLVSIYLNETQTFLMDRTVLDSPISLTKGQSTVIKYRLTNASVLNT